MTATHLAFACLIVLVVAFSRDEEAGSAGSVAALLLLPVLVGAFLLTGSRGAFFALFGSLLMMVFRIQSRSLNRLMLYSAYALIWGAFLLVAIPNPIKARLTMGNVGTLGDRLPIWTTGVDLLFSTERFLLIGAGTGGAAEAIAAYNPGLAISRISEDGIPRANAHSSYVEWIVSFGLLGILVALVASTLILARASGIDRGQSLAFGMGLVAFFFITSFSLIAYRLGTVSIACGALTLGYLYYQRDENSLGERRASVRLSRGHRRSIAS